MYKSHNHTLRRTYTRASTVVKKSESAIVLLHFHIYVPTINTFYIFPGWLVGAELLAV